MRIFAAILYLALISAWATSGLAQPPQGANQTVGAVRNNDREFDNFREQWRVCFDIDRPNSSIINRIGLCDAALSYRRLSERDRARLVQRRAALARQQEHLVGSVPVQPADRERETFLRNLTSCFDTESVDLALWDCDSALSFPRLNADDRSKLTQWRAILQNQRDQPADSKSATASQVYFEKTPLGSSGRQSETPQEVNVDTRPAIAPNSGTETRPQQGGKNTTFANPPISFGFLAIITIGFFGLVILGVTVAQSASDDASTKSHSPASESEKIIPIRSGDFPARNATRESVQSATLDVVDEGPLGFCDPHAESEKPNPTTSPDSPGIAGMQAPIENAQSSSRSTSPQIASLDPMPSAPSPQPSNSNDSIGATLNKIFPAPSFDLKKAVQDWSIIGSRNNQVDVAACAASQSAGGRPMQLKLRRSQRSGGVLGNKVVFALDARADLSTEEKGLVNKYGLGKLVVYDSEARKKRQEAAYGHFDEAPSSGAGRGWWMNARGIASAAMMVLSLRVTVDGLMNGQHIECKDLDELLGAEAAILNACKNLKAYLDTAQTFDGREEVVEF
jgi:hypothetical protein